LVRVSAAELPDDPGAALMPRANTALGGGSASDSDSAAPIGSAPETGGSALSAGVPDPVGHGAPPEVAPVTMKYIPPGWTVQTPLSAHEKVVLGLRDLYDPLNFAAIFASAGYEQLLNGSPNYGTDRGAFGERLGAASIRETTQGLFTDSLFSPMLHEDPRYYIEGPQYGFVHRTLYAITRPLVTRTDSGRTSINGALLLGYAASSALSYTYYPPINRNFHDTVDTFGSGIGGAALGFFVSEFSGDVLHLLHMGKQQ
jgi:hypothetical protein